MAGRVILADGSIQAARLPAQRRVALSPEDSRNPERVAEAVVEHGRVLQSLRESQPPPFIDFRDQRIVASGNTVRLRHAFGVRVAWTLRKVLDNGFNDRAIAEVEADSTLDELVLINRGTADVVCTVRVEPDP